MHKLIDSCSIGLENEIELCTAVPLVHFFLKQSCQQHAVNCPHLAAFVVSETTFVFSSFGNGIVERSRAA
jgi:hypothetical protein